MERHIETTGEQGDRDIQDPENLKRRSKTGAPGDMSPDRGAGHRKRRMEREAGGAGGTGWGGGGPKWGWGLLGGALDDRGRGH